MGWLEDGLRVNVSFTTFSSVLNPGELFFLSFSFFVSLEAKDAFSDILSFCFSTVCSIGFRILETSTEFGSS